MLIEKHNSPFFFKGKLKSFNLKRRLYHPLMWHPLMTVTQMRRITCDFEQVHLLSLSCFCSDSEVKPCSPNSSGRSQQALVSPECCWKISPWGPADKDQSMEGHGSKILLYYPVLPSSPRTYITAGWKSKIRAHSTRRKKKKIKPSPNPKYSYV